MNYNDRGQTRKPSIQDAVRAAVTTIDPERQLNILTSYLSKASLQCQILLLGLLKPVRALDCTLPSDKDPEIVFQVSPWLNRGICFRDLGDVRACSSALSAVLVELDEIRKAEYSGASGVLSLLPTIGALLGAPTSEIWQLLTIVPFGGYLAMALSFGGAIMPVNVQDYEDIIPNRQGSTGSTLSFRTERHVGKDEDAMDDIVKKLTKKIENRVCQYNSARMSKKILGFGLFIMGVLFAGAQAAMVIIERGSIVPWMCQVQIWVHIWYFLVTVATAFESLAQLPFTKQYKLYISSVAYDVELAGGESILLEDNRSAQGSNLGVALEQLGTLRPVTLFIRGSKAYTRPRNAVMVIISVIGDSDKGYAPLWRLLSRAISITVFVMGTALFASTTLLSMLMATLIVTLVVTAGVGSRAMAKWIVAKVSEMEPMIHVIATTKEEAYKAITGILSMVLSNEDLLQVEIDGHVFINQRRVTSRSPWRVALLGVLAKPYDLAKASQTEESMSLIRGYTENTPLSSELATFKPQVSSDRTEEV